MSEKLPGQSRKINIEQNTNKLPIGVTALTIVSQFEFEREAMRLARRLLKANGHLESVGDSSISEPKWNLMVPKNHYRRPVETVPDRLVAEMCSRSWLTAKPGGILRVGAGAGKLFEHGEGSVASRANTKIPIRATELRQSITEEGKPATMLFSAAENPLIWLKRRRDRNGSPYITDVQYAAAEILRTDYTLAHTEPRITFRWQESIRSTGRGRSFPGTGAYEPHESTLASRRRLHKALTSIGPDLSSIAVEVCCLSRGIEAAERRLGYSRRSGRRALLNALDRLAEHYRLNSALLQNANRS